jgi:hypothetical protein
MPRTKQSLRRRSKPHQKRVLKLRARKNRRKAARASHRNRNVRRKGGKLKRK